MGLSYKLFQVYRLNGEWSSPIRELTPSFALRKFITEEIKSGCCPRLSVSRIVREIATNQLFEVRYEERKVVDSDVDRQEVFPS